MEYISKILKLVLKKEVYGTVLFVLAGIILYRLSSSVIDKIVSTGKTEYEKKKRKTIANLFRNIFKYFIVIVVVLVILDLYGYNIKTLIAGLGIAVTVLGLALQDTLKDFIGGITILLENYYVTGDFVKYNEFTGEVIELTLKSTKIKAYTGEVLTIANRNVIEIVNLSQKEACVTLELPVSYETEIEDVEKVINEEILVKAKEIKNANANTPAYLGVNSLENSCVNYLISIKCKQENRWQVKRDLTRIALDSLKKNNIKIPYPQLEVHNAKN